MTNNTTTQWTYTAELYLVQNENKYASSGIITFALVAGASRVTEFSVTMPATEGTYKVYLDIFVGGVFLRGYIATEDIVISAPVPVPPFAYSGMSCSCPKEPDSAWHYFITSVTITNISAAWASARVTLKRYYADDPTDIKSADTQVIVLEPGESIVYDYDSFAEARLTSNETVHFYYEDNDGGRSSECTCRT